MTWTKLSDDFSDDVHTLTDAAFRLHTEGLVWSNRKLLDCFISERDITRLNNPECVAELVEFGVWEETAGGWQIIHHSVYQRSRDDVLKQQKANRANGAKGGRPKLREVWKERPARPGSKSLTRSLSNSQSENKTDSLTKSQNKTHSLSDSLTERDGSGYKEEVKNFEKQSSTTDYTSWDVAPIPDNPAPVTFCNMCRINYHRQTPAVEGTAFCAEHLQELGGAAVRNAA